jgi:hypothetical protein
MFLFHQNDSKGVLAFSFMSLLNPTERMCSLQVTEANGCSEIPVGEAAHYDNFEAFVQ